MITCSCKLVGQTPISFSQGVQSEKKPKESNADFEKRTWREKLHVDKDGYCFIPAMALKISLAAVAKYLSQTIPGKGKATYTKHFVGGIAVNSNMALSIKAKDVSCEEVFVPSDGVRGSGKRVWKSFPTIPTWQTEATIIILDETITDDKLKEYLIETGKFIGLGRFRPQNNGYYGRFSVEDFKVISTD